MKKQIQKERNSGEPEILKISQFTAALRQFSFPKEFRIKPAALNLEFMEEMKTLLINPSSDIAVPSDDSETSAQPQGPSPDSRENLRLLSDIGTGLWRLRQKMVKAGTDEPQEEMRKAFRHFESIWDAMNSADIIIQDHTLAPFDSGLSLKVIAFQPTPGINRETVIETIKPTIYYKGQSIQMGEVIVGTLEKQ